MAIARSAPTLFGKEFNPAQLVAGGAGLASGLFGDSGSPYSDANQKLDSSLNEGKQYQSPFYEAGKAALPQYQESISKMSDPMQFLKSIMGGYQESPWARFQQNQGERAATNAASASGLTGSTPFMQAGQQFARDISSQDMQQFLANILGINSQYQGGLNNLITGGQNSANSITQLISALAGPRSQAAYGEGAGEQNDLFSSLGGLASIGMAFI